MGEEIPEWAIEKACDLLLEYAPGARSNHSVNVFAAYIAQHEPPPVDPDVIAVREIIAAWYEEPVSDYENGNPDGFAPALATYRKHKEAGK